MDLVGFERRPLVDVSEHAQSRWRFGALGAVFGVRRPRAKLADYGGLAFRAAAQMQVGGEYAVSLTDCRQQV